MEKVTYTQYAMYVVPYQVRIALVQSMHLSNVYLHVCFKTETGRSTAIQSYVHDDHAELQGRVFGHVCILHMLSI